MVKNLPACNPDSILWRREWLPTPVFLAREFQGQRSLVDYSPWGHKESGMTEPLTLSPSVLLRFLSAHQVLNNVALRFGDMNFSLYHYWQENIVFKDTYDFKFNWVPFVYFCFIFITLRGGSKEIFLGFMSKSVLPTFSSKGFIVSCLTLRSLIHFEFTFVYGARDCSNFIVLHVTVQFSQHYLLKRLPFLHCIFLTPLS